MTCRERILSEEYADIITDYRLPEEVSYLARGTYCYTPVEGDIGIAYLRIEDVGEISVSPFSYQSIPLCFGLAQDILSGQPFDPGALIDSGILSVQEGAPELSGSGVTVAIIDTGIDYTLPVFRNENGQTRIRAIWDQTIQEGEPPEGILYGTEYRREMIDAALSAENPYTIVPSRDMNGHGTAVAGVAAGSKLGSGLRFNSPAPNCDLVVVKLREAKKYLRDYYLIPEGRECYSESDILMALRYVTTYLRPLSRPLVICLALSCNMGDHGGNSVLSRYLDHLAGRKSVAIVVAGGNEGAEGVHYSKRLPNDIGVNADRVEIRVAEGEPGFVLELWGELPATFTISVRSPSGEELMAGTFRMPQTLEYRFLYEKTILSIDYVLVEEGSGAQLIFMRFVRPAAGIWTIRVTNESRNLPGTYHMWLPLRAYLKEGTAFLTPDPYTTLTEPAYATGVISVAGYNNRTGGRYVDSGRGFSRLGTIKPDLAAPAVEVSSVRGAITGTSMAAAVTTGAVAAFLQWAVVEQNDLWVTGGDVKSYLIRGARREAGLSYPNREEGYGRLYLQGVFDALIGK